MEDIRWVVWTESHMWSFWVHSNHRMDIWRVEYKIQQLRHSATLWIFGFTIYKVLVICKDNDCVVKSKSGIEKWNLRYWIFLSWHHILLNWCMYVDFNNLWQKIIVLYMLLIAIQRVFSFHVFYQLWHIYYKTVVEFNLIKCRWSTKSYKVTLIFNKCWNSIIWELIN